MLYQGTDRTGNLVLQVVGHPFQLHETMNPKTKREQEYSRDILSLGIKEKLDGCKNFEHGVRIRIVGDRNKKAD